MEIYERELSVAEQLEQARTRITQLTAREAELVAERDALRRELHTANEQHWKTLDESKALKAASAKYREALQSIVDDYKTLFHSDWTTAANYADVARNALGEGVV